MQRRPQRGIGKSLVIAAIMLRRNVDGGKSATAERLDFGERLRCLTGMAA